VNDAETQLAARLTDDLERVLGTGILVEDLEIEAEGPVRILVACLVEGAAREFRAEGESVGDAMAGIIRRAAELRQEATFWQVVGPI
jgi:hypothetical protein